MNDAAISYAKQQEELLRQRLADSYKSLTDINQSQTTELQANKDRLLGTINAKQPGIQSAYEDTSRQAYINKVLSSNRLRDNLGRLGLDTTGYGVTQSSMLDTAYGQQIGQADKTKQTALQGLDTERLDVEKGYGADLLKLNTNFLSQKSDMDRYINEQATSVYDKAYANYINEQQREIDNRRAQEQLNLQRQAQAFNQQQAREKEKQNVINTKNGLLKYVGGGFPSNNVDVIPMSNGKTKYIDKVTGNETTLDSNQNPFTGAINPDTVTNGTLDKNKVLSNGYQPNNIGNVDNKVAKTGYTVGDINGNLTNSAGVSIANQSLWKTKDGSIWYWDGPANMYKRMTN